MCVRKDGFFDIWKRNANAFSTCASHIHVLVRSSRTQTHTRNLVLGTWYHLLIRTIMDKAWYIPNKAIWRELNFKYRLTYKLVTDHDKLWYFCLKHVICNLSNLEDRIYITLYNPYHTCLIATTSTDSVSVRSFSEEAVLTIEGSLHYI